MFRPGNKAAKRPSAYLGGASKVGRVSRSTYKITRLRDGIFWYSFRGLGLLKWGHIIPEIDSKEVVEAKMVVYAGQNEGKKNNT